MLASAPQYQAVLNVGFGLESFPTLCVLLSSTLEDHDGQTPRASDVGFLFSSSFTFPHFYLISPSFMFVSGSLTDSSAWKETTKVNKWWKVFTSVFTGQTFP